MRLTHTTKWQIVDREVHQTVIGKETTTGGLVYDTFY